MIKNDRIFIRVTIHISDSEYYSSATATIEDEIEIISDANTWSHIPLVDIAADRVHDARMNFAAQYRDAQVEANKEPAEEQQP
jgi:3-dehydroquinate synthase class II